MEILLYIILLFRSNYYSECFFFLVFWCYFLKTSTPNYKVKKIVAKDETEWIRIEDAHEAIIERRTFDDVQRILQKDIRSAGVSI